MHGLATALLALVMLLPTTAPAATAPQAFQADYDVYRNGARVGQGSIGLRRLPDGRWEMLTRSEAAGGLAGLAGVRREERSLLAWTGRGFETIEYTMRQKAAWKERQESLRVDAAGRVVRSAWKEQRMDLPYRPGVLDRQAVAAALMAALENGRETGTLGLPVASRGSLEQQDYRFAARVRLRTAIGELRAVRVERGDRDGGRLTRMWFAREHGWLPLRIKQYEEDGEVVDMRIARLRGD
ncbi:DUF3108 domain-containing protein [Arenimonas fontis]|uniref:DUF3108 domain-containing protein n=1 Tax=Arenimonas fontis TaxID=2608255 RepID=A0A5B2ZBF0_9GAMM|nr:DUF3108 domain-containing protein [Arenimonas fontis]KAA2284863.1 DUF3108 domain-containing protein [Arenimonas fontis]